MQHRLFIFLGCLCWCCSFFGETLGHQPFSTYGIILSPVLVGIGVVLWFNYYKETRGHYPKFLNVYKDIYQRQRKGDILAGMEFMFSHILESWTLAIVFWIGIVLLDYLTFTNSDPFETTKTYCETNSMVVSKTGKIKGFGVLVGGTIKTGGETGSANLSFTIVGEKGNFAANSELVKKDSRWTVKELTVF